MNKKTIITLCSVVLVLAVTVGATLAYLSAKTNPKENVFTIGEGITGNLVEPKWDGINFELDSNKVEVSETEELGKTLATNFVPGREIPKDPTVENTSDIEVWVAVTLDYSVSGNEVPKKAVDYDRIFASKNAEGSFIGTGFAEMVKNENWEFSDDMKTAYYKTKVPAKSSTSISKSEPVFTQINILNDAKIDDVMDENNVLKRAKIEGFVIDINAYLIQAEGLEYDTAKTELNNLIAEKRPTTTP